MMINVPHIQQRGGSWRYRRKVPPHLREVLGKTEIVIPLARSEADAVKRYAAVHAGVEKQFAAAGRGAGDTPASPLEHFREAQRRVRAMGLDPTWAGNEGEHDPEGIARDVTGDAILAKYPVDNHGNPVGVTAEDASLLNVLFNGQRASRPLPTLADAKRLYEKEKVKGERGKSLQVEHVFKLVSDALPLDTPLAQLRREDAKEVRDCMLDGRSAASVDRYLNVVRAVINHAIKEMDLTTIRNPFMGLEVKERDKAEPDRRKRRGFTDEEVTATRSRVLRMARDDLALVWRILENTGCRLAEVTGLRREDLHLDSEVPHLDVEWHEGRRIKTAVSRRKVPLLGDALEAAREALQASEGHEQVFPAYCRDGGPDAASAALGKHVRACVRDTKVTTHSLRHRIKDLLRLAGVEESQQDLLLGHSSGKVGSDYGSESVRLEVAKRALEAALGNLWAGNNRSGRHFGDVSSQIAP